MFDAYGNYIDPNSGYTGAVYDVSGNQVSAATGAPIDSASTYNDLAALSGGTDTGTGSGAGTSWTSGINAFSGLVSAGANAYSAATRTNAPAMKPGTVTRVTINPATGLPVTTTTAAGTVSGISTNTLLLIGAAVLGLILILPRLMKGK